MTEFETLGRKLSSAPRFDATSSDSFPSVAGVYVFFEDDAALYTGRTKNIRQRIRQQLAGRKEQSAFAMHLVKEKLGLSRDYRPRSLREPELAHAIENNLRLQSERVARMKVSFLPEHDFVKQAMLEIYIAKHLGCLYNEFEPT